MYFLMTGHEIGHMIMAQLYGLKVEFKLTWYALVSNVYGATPYERVAVSVGGFMPIAGAMWMMLEETGYDRQEWFIAISIALIYSLVELAYFISLY